LRDLPLEMFDIAQVPMHGAPETQSALFSRSREFDARYNFNAHLRGQFARDYNLAPLISQFNLAGALIDDPVFFPHTVQELTRLGIPVAAVVHNLESLALIPKDTRHQLELLEREIFYCLQSQMCISISLEETWMLGNFGATCLYYPYYPSKDVEDWLNTIKMARKDTEKKYFLCLGTAFNPSTYQGMIELITMWDTIASPGETLVVAGYGTSLITREAKSSGSVHIAGSLNQEDLFSVLAECRACIVHQTTGSGALTKIPELILAGIPVIASRQAARSHSGTSGMLVYDSIADIAGLIGRDMAPVSGGIDRPSPAGLYARVSAALRLPGTTP
jgi:glycosyltransferase involved in cell wall biosynthesis